MLRRRLVIQVLHLLYNLSSHIGLGFWGSRLRLAFLRPILQTCGKNVFIGKGVSIVYPERVSLGSNISIHQDCYFDAQGGIQIGNDVSIAHSCSLISFNHTYDDSTKPIRDNPVNQATIAIGNDCWLGCKSIILSGCSLGDRTIVAAGAVVNRSSQCNVLVGGVPARVIKHI